MASLLVKKRESSRAGVVRSVTEDPAKLIIIVAFVGKIVLVSYKISILLVQIRINTTIKS